MRHCGILEAVLVLPLTAFAWQQPVAPARVGVVQAPFPAPDQISGLEQKVAINPADAATRTELLRIYLTGPANDEVRQARLRHIRWFIDNDPANPLLGTPLAWIGSAANAGDHENLASLWTTQAAAHFDNSRILLNAIRFLSIEDKAQAESLFARAIAANPGETAMSSRLGFFYAAGLVGSDALDGRVLATFSEDARSKWTDHCRLELDRSADPHVLMGAAIALPNLAMRRTGGGPVYEEWVRYSEELRGRANATDSTSGAARAMPVEFGMFAEEASAASGSGAGLPLTRGPGPPPPPPPPNRLLSIPPAPTQIRVSQNVVAAGLISGPAPVYPPEALQAGVQGSVRFEAVITAEGRIGSLKLISGPPLLVSAAREAVQTWTYRPTILNDKPIAVITTIEVPFTIP